MFPEVVKGLDDVICSRVKQSLITYPTQPILSRKNPDAFKMSHNKEEIITIGIKISNFTACCLMAYGKAKQGADGHRYYGDWICKIHLHVQ